MHFTTLLHCVLELIVLNGTKTSVNKCLLFQDMAYFDDPDNNIGALTTRLSTDASQVQGVGDGVMFCLI